MYHLKYISTLLALLLVCGGAKAIELKDDNGNYRHDVAEVRAELLSIAQALRVEQMYPKAEKLYSYLAKKWSAAGHSDDLENACTGLFATLLNADRLEEYETAMEFCPSVQVRSEFLGLAQRSNAFGAVQIYQYVIPRWQQPEQQRHLIKACRRLTEVLVTEGKLEELASLLEGCDPAEVRKGRLSLAERYVSGRQLEKAVELYQQYLVEWNLPEALQEQTEACAALTALHLRERDDVEVERLKGSCSPESIRSGYLRWARYFEFWGKDSKAIGAYRKLIGEWQQPTQADDLFRACQFLHWILVKKDRENKIDSYMADCPSQGYARVMWESGQSLLMDGYIVSGVRVQERKYKPLRNIQPQYPRRALEKGIQGYVIVEFDIDKSGKPVNLRVVESTDNVFHHESLRAAEKLRYKPVIVDGEPVEVPNVPHKYTFQLEDDDGPLPFWQQGWG